MLSFREAAIKVFSSAWSKRAATLYALSWLQGLHYFSLKWDLPGRQEEVNRDTTHLKLPGYFFYMTLINLHLVLIFSCMSSIWSSSRVSNSSSFCKVVSSVVRKSMKGLEMGYYKMNAPKNADRCCHILRYRRSSRKSEVMFRHFSPLCWLLLGNVHSSTKQKTAEMERAWLFGSLICPF